MGGSVSAPDPSERETVTDVLRLAGRSPAAARLASDALRAAAVGSPVLGHRIQRAVTAALADRAAEWSPEERSQLSEALAATAGPDRDREGVDESTRRVLSALVADTPDPLFRRALPLALWARILGCNIRSLRRWLGGQLPIGRSTAAQLGSITGVTVTADEVIVRYRRALAPGDEE